MEIRLETIQAAEVDADWLVVPVGESREPDASTATLDEALGGTISRLREAGDLTGKLAETLALHDVTQIPTPRILLVGLGKPDKLDAARLDKALATAARSASEKKESRIAVSLPATGTLDAGQVAQTAATALVVGSAGQGLYQAERQRFEFSEATLLADPAGDQTSLTAAVETGRVLGESINLTRELVNRMAGEIYPESFADRAQQLAADCGLVCTVLDESQLRVEKMGSLLAVAQGSDRPPRVVVLEHRGGGDDAPLLGLVGKGVTFDSGGLSLKPNDSMKDMKCDMAGAATVLGAVCAIARLNLPVNVIGFMGLVENMVSGSSYKLGDVLIARNGTTIEVLNTDAEGRLVLADVLSYAVDRGVDRLVDLATLTGSCVVALGEEIVGAFSNEQTWCNTVLAAAKSCGENIWQMPLEDDFADLLKSDVADCKNVGPRWGGAITAAKFLEKFVGEKPWVHLDIAGPAFASTNKPHREGGATGCMLRTLVGLAAGFGGS